MRRLLVPALFMAMMIPVASLAAPELVPGPSSLVSDDALLPDLLDRWVSEVLPQLRLPDMPPPHRSLVAVDDLETYAVRARFGELIIEDGGQKRPTRLEVVVGDDTLDSSRHRVRERPMGLSGDGMFRLVADDLRLPLARDLWLGADSTYREALVRLARKVSARAAQEASTNPPDWSVAPVIRDRDLSPVPAIDRARLRELVLRSSSALRPIAGLRVGQVSAKAEEGRYLFSSSEGAGIVERCGHAVLRASVGVLRDDGVELSEDRTWVARTAAGLPEVATLVGEVTRMAETVIARASAPKVEFYEGPVLFEGDAAADFFRQLASPELYGTPPLPDPDRTYDQLVRGGPRIGRRLLPPGWTIVDDPRREGQLGAYKYDRQGVPGQPVRLVDDGHVRDLLMTRVPRREILVSNGHARGAIERAWWGRLSVWEVQAPKQLSEGRFERVAMAAMKASGQDRLLVVRALATGKEGTFPRPTSAVWRFADGHEEPILSLQFQRMDRRALRDILAASGGQRARSYLAPFDSEVAYDGEEGIPTTLFAPGRLLVEGIELVFPGPDRKPASYPEPLRTGS